VPEVGDAARDHRDLAFLSCFPDKGMRPVPVSRVDLSANKQELVLVLAVLNEHAAGIVGQPAMHLPHWQSVRHGVLAPSELSPSRVWCPGSGEGGHTKIEADDGTACVGSARSHLDYAASGLYR
jgi:hypothetical protein